MGPGASESEAKWVPGVSNRGLEAPGTSKISSWIVWKAVWRAWGSFGRPSWGSRGRFGCHLALGRPRKRFGVDLGGFGGPKRVQKSNFFDTK